MGKFFSTKTYGNETGLSCVFRQWRSTHSHCSLLHGYAIGVKVTFGCSELDERNWVMDYGGLKPFKRWLEETFDHTVLVAKDDPLRQSLLALAAVRHYDSAGAAEAGGEYGGVGHKLVKVVEVENTGCEAFAKLIHDKLSLMIKEGEVSTLNKTVYVHSVEVFEHGANSAIYTNPR